MIRFEPSGGAAPELDRLITSSFDTSSLLLVTVDPAPSPDWTTQSVIAIADRMAALGPTLLVDLIPDSTLHETLGTDNFEGLADVFQFGASLKHVLHSTANHRFNFIGAGAAAEFETILSDSKWRRLLSEAQANGLFVIVHTNAAVAGLDHIAARVGSVALLSVREDVQLDGIRESAVIGPFPVPPAPAKPVPAAPAPPAPAPVREKTPEEQYESIKVPRNAAREALIADLRSRQRAALMTPPPAVEESAPQVVEGEVPQGSRSAEQIRSRPTFSRPIPSITEPTFADTKRKRGVKSRRALFWALSLAVIAAFVVGGWLVLQRYVEVTEVQGDSAVVVPPRQQPVMPLAYSVAVEAHQQLPIALERVNALRSDEPDMDFYIAPIVLDNVLYYRVLAGPLADSAAAGAVMRRLLEKGHKTGATQWDVRAAPLAFLLGEFESRSAAEQKVTETIDVSIPAYIVPLPMPDGAVRYRVYAGSFAGIAEADVMRQLLKNLGLPDTLVVRLGARK